MQTSIMSYSFRRSFEKGEMDVWSYLAFSREHGLTHYEPWNMHLQEGVDDDAYIDRVRAAADAAGLRCGCLAVDRGHVYEEEAETRARLRRNARRWIDIARRLGATQVRIDAGGPEEMPDPVFQVIVEGFTDLVSYGREQGVEILTENHWGPTKHPDNLVKLLQTVDGLGLLLDTNNWAPGRQEEGWERCAEYARAVHIKTFQFDADGNDPTVDLSRCFRVLRAAGYNGVWGIESVPVDGDERRAALMTLALIRREVADR